MNQFAGKVRAFLRRRFLPGVVYLVVCGEGAGSYVTVVFYSKSGAKAFVEKKRKTAFDLTIYVDGIDVADADGSAVA